MRNSPEGVCVRDLGSESKFVFVRVRVHVLAMRNRVMGPMKKKSRNVNH